MTLSQLGIFSLVAELRGFTAAAARLQISQSAVSHAIRALEKELGVELIRRQQTGVELTDIGQQLLLRARSMLGLAETMRQEAADARGMKRGTLRIGSFGPSSSIRILPPILQAYRKKYPGIEVHVDEGADRHVQHWIADRRIDVGFLVLPEEGFDTFTLARDQMVAVVPLPHPLAKKAAVRLSELCESPFVLTQAGSAELVSRLFMAENLSPNIRYRSAQLISTLETVACGEAVTIIAELALPDQPPERPRYAVKPLDPPVMRSIGLGVLDMRHISPATRTFIDLSLQMSRSEEWGRDVHR